jgi:subfamily B ATP-binding cassette protein MsbA
LVPCAVALGFFAALAEGVGLSLFIPLLYTLDADVFTPAKSGFLGNVFQGLFSGIPASERLFVIAVGIMGFVLLKNILFYANEVLKSWIRTLLVHSLRARLADQFLNVGIDYVERTDSGKLLNALQSQAQETGAAFATHVELLIRACTAVVFGILLLLISWKLTLGVGVMLLGVSLLARVAWRRLEAGSRKFVSAWDDLSQRSIELLSGMRTIRVFDRVEYERDRYARASERASRVWFHLDLLSGLIRPVSEVLIAGVLVVVLVTTLRDAANLPMVLTFVFILYRLRPHVQGIDIARAQLLAAKGPVETVLGMLDPADKPRVVSGARPFENLHDSIRFENVTFRYAGADCDALQDVCVRIPAAATTALIGRSGAGKSTLVHLVLRLYDATTGTVWIDDVPLRDLELRSWRRRIAVVTQDAILFNTTVRDNIGYGRTDATAQDVIRAGERAGADDFIRALPQGYDTIVGDQAVRLSGGQKQRLALARALVREPRILILDEATNALDAETESIVQDAVAAMGKELTVIVVSHRLSAVARADYFVLLEAGRVTAQGDRTTFSALKDTVYRLYGADLEDQPDASDELSNASIAGVK